MIVDVVPDIIIVTIAVVGIITIIIFIIVDIDMNIDISTLRRVRYWYALMSSVKIYAPEFGVVKSACPACKRGSNVSRNDAKLACE